MVAGGGVTNKGAVDSGRRCKYFTCGQVGPVTRADKAASFYPVEAAVKMGRERRACLRLDGKSFRSQHALAKFVAQTIHHAVIGAHALLHDLRSYTHHMGIANLTALDDAHDSHACTKLSGLGSHAHDARVRRFEGMQDICRSFDHRARTKIFE